MGGRSAPVGVLGELGEHLVVVHGQSEQLRLKSAAAQREALDRFAGQELATVLGDYQDVFRRWQSEQSELDVLVAERDRRGREAEELRIAMEEIEKAAPQRGEDDELAERAARLTNLEDLRLAAAEAQERISSQLLDGGPDAVALVEGARHAVERVVEHDTALAPILEALTSASFALSEVSAQLSHYLGGSTRMAPGSWRRSRSAGRRWHPSSAATGPASTRSSTISNPAAPACSNSTAMPTASRCSSRRSRPTAHASRSSPRPSRRSDGRPPAGSATP
ncbi:hypothetical protein GCM10025881_03250 [Pseudolysinimonas kribbensis]|uniref:DNA repair protein RecN n=1 Tax=Pseudolysinimonas kribbensis TaxID=433641 RepID=A0ABQ6K3Z5_9MICO|nr:hypothetical protein GCM10025881_03250 [Pseudolysinimonas kribbensis]